MWPNLYIYGLAHVAANYPRPPTLRYKNLSRQGTAGVVGNSRALALEEADGTRRDGHHVTCGANNPRPKDLKLI